MTPFTIPGELERREALTGAWKMTEPSEEEHLRGFLLINLTQDYKLKNLHGPLDIVDNTENEKKSIC